MSLIISCAILFNFSAIGETIDQWIDIETTTVAKNSSKDRFTVAFGYKTYIQRPDGCLKCDTITYATPLWIKIYSDKLNKNSIVDYVLTIEKTRGTWVENFSYILESTSMEDHFASEFTDAKLKFGDTKEEWLDAPDKLAIEAGGTGGTVTYVQELGVFVDYDGDLETQDDQFWLEEVFMSLYEKRFF